MGNKVREEDGKKKVRDEDGRKHGNGEEGSVKVKRTIRYGRE